ncbi:MAG TPA: MFS transporter [Nocardioides sp.]|uniref:MFS transporter n=1 Tax=Nocardioides sp. TaxID=35761 RepID=UPI002ED981E9
MSRRTHLLALAAILLLAVNLRPAAVSVGPVLADLRPGGTGLGMGAGAAGLLTSLPVIAFAVVGSSAPWLARRFGVHRVTLVGLLAVTVGLVARSLAGGTPTFLLLSLVALGGMALANVLLPSLVKLHFPDRVGRVTALYTTLLAVGLTLALTLTVPISSSLGSWRWGLAAWGLLAVAAMIPWLPMLVHDRSIEPAPRIGFLEVLRTPIALAMVGFFGCQSLQAYVVFGWFPTVWRDAGYTAAQAGALVGVVAATSIPLSLWAPAALARTSRPALLVLGIMACYPIGYAGLLVAPYDLAILWAVLVGVGSACFPLVLVLINLRSRTPAGTATLSSVTQSLGYLLAATGPYAIGLLHDRTGGWTVPLWTLIAVNVPQLLLALYAVRPVFVEDQLRRR